MKGKGELIKTWEVVRKAGIKKQFLNEIKGEIDKHLEQ
jgi:hypothetical protein